MGTAFLYILFMESFFFPASIYLFKVKNGETDIYDINNLVLVPLLLTFNRFSNKLLCCFHPDFEHVNVDWVCIKYITNEFRVQWISNERQKLHFLLHKICKPFITQQKTIFVQKIYLMFYFVSFNIFSVVAFSVCQSLFSSELFQV